MDYYKYSAQELHILGEKLREKDKLKEAADVLTLAVVKYTISKDYEGLADALQSRFLTWKHYYLLFHKRDYLKLAHEDAKASLFTAKRKNIRKKLASCYFRLGEYYMLRNFYQKASHYFRKAIFFHRGKLSEKGDYRYHLGESIYRLGKKKEGKVMILEGLSEIEKGKDKIDEFLFNVWKSGCLMKLAELLKDDNYDEAGKYFELAELIIKSDQKLVIRKRQLREMKKLLVKVR